MIWKPNVTVAAVVQRDGKFLLVEEETDAGLAFNQPAGHLEDGEALIDALRHRPVRLCNRNGPALDGNFAFVGGVIAAEDLDQRSFARTIGTYQRVNTPRFHIEADVIQRHNAGKSFTKVSCFEECHLEQESGHRIQSASERSARHLPIFRSVRGIISVTVAATLLEAPESDGGASG